MFYLQFPSTFVLVGFLVNVVAAAVVDFDCTVIPETCNNMCFGANMGVYFELHFDPNTANRPGRRTAAGCRPNPNRCNSNPPTPDRTTCDEYPFASTHGVGTGGWFSGTGATTRCVSVTECNSQGGTLSAFYSSFGSVDQTAVDVFVSGFSATVAPFCNNAGMATDGQFAIGGQPPTRRRSVADSPGGLYEYRTKGNRTVLSLSGPKDIGTKIFFARPDWQSNPKALEVLNRRQDDAPNDDCNGSSRQIAAASRLSDEELGETDTIAAFLGKR